MELLLTSLRQMGEIPATGGEQPGGQDDKEGLGAGLFQVVSQIGDHLALAAIGLLHLPGNDFGIRAKGKIIRRIVRARPAPIDQAGGGESQQSHRQGGRAESPRAVARREGRITLAHGGETFSRANDLFQRIIVVWGHALELKTLPGHPQPGTAPNHKKSRWQLPFVWR